ncbi:MULTISPECIES: delta-lactam-biosynthetic de-N-acetylase [Paenibacillus]|jgi:peptidoglycan-N-acetylmuramic acid deacetylase|uniref:Delta-lactam-biosynthetic de-N-acetylase n=1 Tax=Paenibacillus oceani TaxID=2772510 RepID=A0A927CC85_9BACL|nr:delta-lactam-biosynthetic de-N-acetylase [Paenibacillus oceani]MBD2863917.1 delta-lactam-biosynthetic de-N-acetylase [Paenibacillus oceani]MDF2658046.1 polysaccharide deacetylase [Paenibacillus sp.]
MRKLVNLVCIAAVLAYGLAADIASAEASGSQPYHFGFKKSRNGAPASIDEEGFKPVLETYDAIFRRDGTGKTLYLTFDNGYENGHTPKILDVLKEKKVPALFFVTGQFIREQPHLLKRMSEEGHRIGNHSWSHPDLTQISDERLASELKQVKDSVAELTGQQEMPFLRPPRGIFSERTLAVSRKLGYINVFWSIAYVDWDTNKQQGWRHAFDKVTGQLHPGAVILLHSVSSDNAEAMGSIIDYAREQGYEFKHLEVIPGGV